LSSWLQTQWNNFATSYDAPAAAVQSSPSVILLSIGSLVIGFLTIGYAPGLAALSEFRSPWLPSAFAVAGAICSYSAWKHQATGRVGTACMFLDTLLYTTALSLAAVLTVSPFSVGFAIALALFLIGFPARVYALTAALAVAICTPPLVLTILLEREPLVVFVMWAGCTVALALSRRTGQQRALREQNERLRSALGAADRVAEQSMEAALAASLLDIGHFLHELRNLRAVQQTNLQFVKEEGGVHGEALEALEDAIAAQALENELISKAIDGLRKRAQPTQESFVLHDAVREFASERADKFPLEFALASPRFSIRGDRHHVKAVLNNLIRNADKAGATRAKVELKANPDAKSVLLIVEDDGPGLKEHQIPDLFRPFATGGRADGTGLGLYLTRRYVNLLGGTIEASNRAEGGACFRMLIPAHLTSDSDRPAR
jgi:signal transduction histidine kinase